MRDLRGWVALVLALTIAGVLGVGAWRWIVTPGTPTPTQTVTLATTLGALIGAVSVYLGTSEQSPQRKGRHMTEPTDETVAVDELLDGDEAPADEAPAAPADEATEQLGDGGDEDEADDADPGAPPPA